MNIKPSDFFIGVIDFFSVILPGALVTYFLKGQFYSRFFGDGKTFPLPENAVQGWIIFLLATYIIGNIIFLIGSFLFDTMVYDKLLRNAFFKKNLDLAYHTATAIREQFIPSASWINQLVATKKLKEQEIEKLFKKDKREIINTFKWAQHFLSIKYPETLVEIKKFEADSKFFRSLVVSFIIIGAVLLGKEEWISATCFFVLSLLSLYRYGELRYKSTERAYELIITINHLEKSPLAEISIQTMDNRARFLASDKVAAPYQGRIAALTKGLQVSSEVVAITMNETWKVMNSTTSETLYCLSGRCVAKIKKVNEDEEKVILTSGAIIPLPLKSSFEINNRQPEPLLMLSVK